MCTASFATSPIPSASSARRKASYEAFGNVHVVCNNAGVAAGGGIDNISLDNWRWVLDVNLMGVLHGIRTFLPHIRAPWRRRPHRQHRVDGRDDQTAGVQPLRGEQVRGGRHVGGARDAAQAASASASACCVRALCAPGIGESGRNRPAALWPDADRSDPASPAAALVAEIARRLQTGLDPAAVAARVLAAIRERRTLRVHAPGNAR